MNTILSARAFAASTFLALASCVATQGHMDEMAMRQNATDYYEAEIMENLIRGKEGRLMLHVNVGNMQATVNTKLTAKVSGGRTTGSTSARTLTNQSVVTNSANRNGLGIVTSLGHTVAGTLGLVTAVGSSVSKPFNLEASPERNNQIQVTASVETDPAYYAPYMQFLKLKSSDLAKGLKLGNMKFDELDLAGIESVQKWDGKTRLKEGDYVSGTLTRWNGDKYYIPIQFRGAYFDLCLALLTKNKINSKTVTSPEVPHGMRALSTKALGAPILKPQESKVDTNDILEQLKRNEGMLNSIQGQIR